MTLFNSKRIIKKYWEILTFAIFKKDEISLKKFKKKCQKSTKFFKKVIIVTKIPNTFDF